MSPIFGAPEALAASRCLTARSLADRRGPWTTQHPRTCAWCDTPLEELRALIDGWNAWAGYHERSNTYSHHEIRRWAELPADVKEAQIVEAQGLVPPPPGPSTGPAAAPALQGEPASTEEVAWLPSR